MAISKLVKFGERVDAELDIESFRHMQLRSMVQEKSKATVKDRRVLSKARVISSSDIVRLRAEKESKNKVRKVQRKTCRKGKKAKFSKATTAGSETSDSHEQLEDVDILMEDAGDQDEDEWEDVVVVGGNN